MKILLINPSVASVYGDLPPSIQIPLGLAYIAASLEKAKHDVRVVDVEAEGLVESQVLAGIKGFGPALVGITCSTPTFYGAVELCGKLKELNPGIKTVLGGIHPTIEPGESLSPESVDFVVIGEGEKTIIELADALTGGKDFSGVKGLAFKKGNIPVINGPRELIQDLDEIPFPARHLFKNQRYTYPDSMSGKTFPVITSRGCPGECTYCNTKNIFGKRFRRRSPRNVVDEIESLVASYGAEEIHVWDDNFTTDKKRVFGISEEIKKRNIRIKLAFPNGVRADFLNRDVLQALKDMGTYSIAIGVESGSQFILDKAKKGIKLQDIREIFRLIKGFGFETWAFFMLGLWGETEDTIKETIKFAIEIDPDIAKFHILKPFPGTEIYCELKEKKLLLTEDYSRFGIHSGPIHRLETLSPDDILQWQKKAYRMFFLRPGKIIHQLFRLKSFYRIKLNLIVGFAFLRKMFNRKKGLQ